LVSLFYGLSKKSKKKCILLITILKQFPITTISGRYTNDIGDLYRIRHRVELFAMIEGWKYKNLYCERHETSAIGAHTYSHRQDGRRRERKLTCPQRRFTAHFSVIVIIFMIIVIYLFLFYFALQVVKTSRVPTGF